jgi:hypothetical protein
VISSRVNRWPAPPGRRRAHTNAPPSRRPSAFFTPANAAASTTSSLCCTRAASGSTSPARPAAPPPRRTAARAPPAARDPARRPAARSAPRSVPRVAASPAPPPPPPAIPMIGRLPTRLTSGPARAHPPVAPYGTMCRLARRSPRLGGVHALRRSHRLHLRGRPWRCRRHRPGGLGDSPTVLHRPARASVAILAVLAALTSVPAWATRAGVRSPRLCLWLGAALSDPGRP